MSSKFFIERPIFAAVLSIVIVLAGLVALRILPIAPYPEIAPLDEKLGGHARLPFSSLRRPSGPRPPVWRGPRKWRAEGRRAPPDATSSGCPG